MNEFALENKYDIFCLSEHWCRDLEIPYKKCDSFILASSYCRKEHIRGGVAIYLSKALHVTCSKLDLDFLCDELNFEAAGIVINCIGIKLLIVSLYRSPNGNCNTFLERFDCLLDFLSGSKWESYEIILGGDVNSDFDVTNDNKQSVRDLKNLLRQFNLKYANTEPTRYLACLDNIFTNVNITPNSCQVMVFPDSDHRALTLMYEMRYSEIETSRMVTTRPINDEKINYLKESLNEVDWEKVLKPNINVFKLPAEVIFDRFFKLFLSIYDRCIPRRTCKVHNKSFKKRKLIQNSSWYTPQLAVKKKQVVMLLDFFNIFKTYSARAAYVKCRNEYKLAITEAKRSFNQKLIENSNNKCKAAWKLINAVANDNKKTIGQTSPDSFNDFFIDSVNKITSTVKNSNVDPLSLLTKDCCGPSSLMPQNSFAFYEVSPELVLSIVKNFKNSDSVDVYDMSCNLLKKIIYNIVYPLTYCINMCLSQGFFPLDLKMSRVVPIYKKGDKDSPASYRPVSIVPAIGKVFETIMYLQLSSYFEKNNLINETQFGFRRGKSTSDAIEYLTKVILQVFEDRGFAQITFCDLSKAFDCVNHDTLVKKLEFYGVGGNSIQLLKYYLENRSQIVSVGDTKSNVAQTKIGVPQGSVLGPFLFLIMINDLPSYVGAHTVLYADDTTFLSFSKDFDSLRAITDSTLAKASCWFESNGFLLNEGKTQQMYFSLREIPPSDDPNSVKFLGVYIDSKLTWEAHINYVSGKLASHLFVKKP